MKSSNPECPELAILITIGCGGFSPALAGRIAEPGITSSGLPLVFTPSVPDGQPAPSQTSLTTALHVSIGGLEAKVTYDGLTPNSYGLYQFNVVIPQVPSGDQVPLTFTLGGTTGAQTLYLPVSLTATSGV